MNNEPRDEALWKMAKKRASFKWSFYTYVFINTFLICIWYFTSGPGSYFWPVWPVLGWGVGIIFQYLHAYQGDKMFTAGQEYERLKNQQNNK